MHRTAPIFALIALLAASPALADGITVTVGTETAIAGQIVSVPVSLDTAGEEILQVRNDIVTSSLLPLVEESPGDLDCNVEGNLTSNVATFTCLERATDENVCVRVRAIVRSESSSILMSGGTLYSCRFAVDARAAADTYPLTNLAVAALDPLGHVIAGTKAKSGAVEVRLPTPTVTASETETAVDTPTATDTPSRTFSPTATISPSRTPTRTPFGPTRTSTKTPTQPTATRTVTPTVTRTRTSTPTVTATQPITYRVSGGFVRPGDPVEVVVDLTDELGRATQAGFDLFLSNLVFDAAGMEMACAKDPQLTAHTASAVLVAFPPPPPNQYRLRFVISDLAPPADLLPNGPLVRCRFDVRPQAPIGATPLTLDRYFAFDTRGTLISTVGAINGEVVVDPDPPTPTSTPTQTQTATPTETSTRTVTPSRTPTRSPTVTRTPTVTATPAPCFGDCTADGSVTVDDLALAVRIALGIAPAAECIAADASGDRLVTVDELVAAMRNALGGCP